MTSLINPLRMGLRIEQIRQQVGLSKLNVANEVGVSYIDYCQYENGNKIPDDETLAKIAHVLGIKSQDLEGRPDLSLVSTEDLLEELNRRIES